MTEGTKRCRTVGRWTVVVPSAFEEVDSGDSWQAADDTRCVYLSSRLVRKDGEPTPAASLLATISQVLGRAPGVDRHDFDDSGHLGAAQITREESGFILRGVTCVPGAVATCAINFEREQDRSWALATWKSVRYVPGEEPWWKLW